ncbi:4,5-DOPA dioxygenase extradiol [Serratia sp. UGAL515B_01]|uniref:4,5-DOPA-extradiol-dioxygenase n=1 Tax=Serratia sp. UGAL515B_01 TaxID=2986763 RepID=UPI00295388D2|nr:4,5-DOPA dioxygenase extradiol [Serratia sp. UGAL515B_01]WON76470.1 4,5-DOPA dioxygenase extradiol [Serratia sp. UGAL515B_01]
MSTSRMPALFLGHGSPMNVLEDNRYTQAWRALGEQLPRPRAIVAVSAHWYTRGTAVTAMAYPKTIHDFGGFPKALFDTQYPAPGSPELAAELQNLLSPIEVIADIHEWGLDHGSWGVLIKMYPQADIPVVQLSIDGTQPAEYHYQLGQKLAVLRERGVMIVASGNVVHNLRMAKWHGDTSPYPWAESFNRYIIDNLSYQGLHHPLVNFMQHEGAALSNPTPEHYLPLLYVLGGWDGNEPISIPIDGIEVGALSMLSVQVG